MRKLRLGIGAGAAAVLAIAIAVPIALSGGAPKASRSGAPDLVALLAGYDRIWTPADRTANSLHGSVRDAAILERDDELTVWINAHATAGQQFRALQDAQYRNGDGTYDQSLTISTALGSELGPLYVGGSQDGSLPLTTALLNSSNGTSGAYVVTGAAKWHYSHPRPFLAAAAKAAPVDGDSPACAPASVNASSLVATRIGRPWANADGSLRIRRVADTTDTTHQFGPADVPLSAGYGNPTLCTGGSFPSGHATAAYQAGIGLATLLPELAPEILARASEAANNRIVLGVHSPLDIVGGRIGGEAALAARWSDASYRTRVLEPARAELVGYLEKGCGAALASCIARQQPYRDDPYGGDAMPGGTAQVVDDRASAVAVCRERLDYGFAAIGSTTARPSVPAGAGDLLRTAFPTLTPAQRTAVLAQTELPSGDPLDLTAAGGAAWQRLDLAAAMSATVRIAPDGSATVTRTGGSATVVR